MYPKCWCKRACTNLVLNDLDRRRTRSEWGGRKLYQKSSRPVAQSEARKRSQAATYAIGAIDYLMAEYEYGS